MGDAKSAAYGRLQQVLVLHAVDALGFDQFLLQTRIALRLTADQASKLVKLVRTMRVATMSASRWRAQTDLIRDAFNAVAYVQAQAS